MWSGNPPRKREPRNNCERDKESYTLLVVCFSFRKEESSSLGKSNRQAILLMRRMRSQILEGARAR